MYKSIIAVLLAVIISIGGWGLLRVTALDNATAVNATHIEQQRQDINRLYNRFDKIEDKIDAVLDRSRTRPAPRVEEDPHHGRERP
jgi:hypothetical protein